MSERITGIENYCDRWCEQCTMTASCAVFSPGTEVVGRKEFRSFREAYHTLRLWAADRDIEMAAIPSELTEAEQKRRNKNQRTPRTNETSRLALDYRLKLSDFLRSHQAKWAALPTERNLDFAILTLSRMEAQLVAKITRAYIGRSGFDAAKDDPVQNDHNGSAKVAIIHIEKSFPAWDYIALELPQLANDCRSMLLLLDRIRVALLADFPDLAKFVRPGFDTASF